MASKRRLRRNACDGKRRYPTLRAAIHAAVQLVRSGHARRPLSLWGYGCSFCHGAHIGHRG